MRKWFGKYVNDRLKRERDLLRTQLLAAHSHNRAADQECDELLGVVCAVAEVVATGKVYRPDAEDYGTFAWETIKTVDRQAVRNALGEYASGNRTR